MGCGGYVLNVVVVHEVVVKCGTLLLYVEWLPGGYVEFLGAGGIMRTLLPGGGALLK